MNELKYSYWIVKLFEEEDSPMKISEMGFQILALVSMSDNSIDPKEISVIIDFLQHNLEKDIYIYWLCQSIDRRCYLN